MKARIKNIVIILLVMMVIVTACSSKALVNKSQPEMGEELPAAPAGRVADGQGLPVPMATMAPEDMANKSSTDIEIAAATLYRSDRMIVKNAEIRLLVADTDVAIDRLTQVVSDVGGYIISSRVWYQPYFGKNYKYSSITIGIPVDQFERALRRSRELAVRVLDENASGQDVTDQFVDLQSRLGNLEATRDRIRGFLEQAKTVEEALRVNQELANIDQQIEEIKGRMNYLSDRSAYSTITIQIDPELPEINVTPTPPPSWDPGDTFGDAWEILVKTYQGFMDMMIWVGVVFVPIAGPWLLIGYGVWRVSRRRLRQPPVTPGD